MSTFPEPAAQVVEDYLARVRAQLCVAPEREREEFLRELRSHIYEAYQQDQGTADDIAKILRVLRKLGEPAEVVADMLPRTMVRNGKSQSWPLYVLGGLFIALFGIPLGIGGVGVLVGIVIAAAGIVVSYYAAAGVMLLAAALFLSLGLARLYRPDVWDALQAAGVIQMHPEFADVMDRLSLSAQGSLMIFLAIVFAAAGLCMLWLGKYLIRGLRFLVNLILDWVQRSAQVVRRAWSRRQEAKHSAAVAFFVSPRETTGR